MSLDCLDEIGKEVSERLSYGKGSPRKWQPITPAMAAGLTDHIWITSELLSFRVPVWFSDNLHSLESLFPSPQPFHQGS